MHQTRVCEANLEMDMCLKVEAHDIANSRGCTNRFGWCSKLLGLTKKRPKPQAMKGNGESSHLLHVFHMFKYWIQQKSLLDGETPFFHRTGLHHRRRRGPTLPEPHANLLVSTLWSWIHLQFLQINSESTKPKTYLYEP